VSGIGAVARAVAPALLVAAGYYFSGRLGLLLALPPGYASAAWPPSGIALAGLLLAGWRVVPGIWLGSFLLNVGTSFSAEALVASLGVPVVIGAGATAQAALGAWLIRRRGQPANILTAGTDVIPLLVLGGPVACLLNATVAVGTLWLAGRVPEAAVPYNWWTWWIGDSIGVLLFTPLVLVWAVRPWETWLRRQVYVTAPLALLFAVVVALFVVVTRREEARIESGFRALAADVHQALRVRLDNTLAALSSIEGLYAGRDEVQPAEFEIFAQRLLRHLEGVSGLAWSPHVPHARRAAFEASGRAGRAGFRITELAEDGSLRTAGPRAWYAPVETVAPRADVEAVLGFDVASGAARRAAVEEARDSGQAVASGVVPLAHSGERGLLVVLPVYALGVPEDTPDARRDRLKGYAVAAFSHEGLFGAVGQRAAAAGVSLAISDRSDSGAPVPMYGTAPAPGDLRQEFAVTFARRAWRLELGLAEQAVVARRSWEAWTVLACGLMLTVLLGIVLLAGVGRTAQVEALVAQRTGELRRTGAQLARSNRELEQYAYVTSHDLKAPLRTIASFAQLLAERHGATLEGEAREFLAFIRGGTERMQQLIDDLLELSRVDARKLDVVPLSMRVAVDRARGALAADLDTSGAQLHIGELPFVRGDLHMLGQVWQNLLANAIKFQRPGQKPEIHIDAAERAGEWAFSIRDNGIGILPAHREHVFLVFRRLHTAEEYSGTGIGLAICKKVVQLHGGEIWVESSPGPGTTIRFTLPKADAAG
jgi:signal transduction histidine kinase